MTTTPATSLVKHRFMFIHGTLIQESAASVGGSNEGDTDMSFARDGSGRLTILGTTLAGALIETAGKIFPQIFVRQADGTKKGMLWELITGKSHCMPRDKDDVFRESVWQFSRSHPFLQSHPLPDALTAERRAGVGIRQATGAASNNKLYDVETLPKGTRWPFWLTIDLHRGGEEATYVAALALTEWIQGRCWIGRGVARGLGWMRLDKDLIEVVKTSVPRRKFAAPQCDEKARDSVNEDTNASWKDLYEEARQWLAEPRQPWAYLRIEGEIRAGEAARNPVNLSTIRYGLDTLAVGSHAASLLTAPSVDNRPLGLTGAAKTDEKNAIVAPAPEKKSRVEQTDDKKSDPDHVLSRSTILDSNDETGNTKHEAYFVPGSAIRGVLRHTLSAWLRGVPNPSTLEIIYDPLVDEDKIDKDDPVAALFGSIEHGSSRLLISDAYPVISAAKPEGDVKVFQIQHHAEDEFTAGTFDGALFNRRTVVNGVFKFSMVVEARCVSEIQTYVSTTLQHALRLAELGFVELGGGVWRGDGWPEWKFTSANVALAGEAEPCESIAKQDGRISDALDTLLASAATEYAAALQTYTVDNVPALASKSARANAEADPLDAKVEYVTDLDAAFSKWRIGSEGHVNCFSGASNKSVAGILSELVKDVTPDVVWIEPVTGIQKLKEPCLYLMGGSLPSLVAECSEARLGFTDGGAYLFTSNRQVHYCAVTKSQSHAQPSGIPWLAKLQELFSVNPSSHDLKVVERTRDLLLTKTASIDDVVVNHIQAVEYWYSNRLLFWFPRCVNTNTKKPQPT